MAAAEGHRGTMKGADDGRLRRYESPQVKLLDFQAFEGQQLTSGGAVSY